MFPGLAEAADLPEEALGVLLLPDFTGGGVVVVTGLPV
jgi:hypothetical protein